MARQFKLTPDITQLIGDNVALGLPYTFDIESAGITYQKFNDWMRKGKIQHIESIFSFFNISRKVTQQEL